MKTPPPHSAHSKLPSERIWLIFTHSMNSYDFSTFELFDCKLTPTEDLQNFYLNQMNFMLSCKLMGTLTFKKKAAQKVFFKFFFKNSLGRRASPEWTNIIRVRDPQCQ